MKTAFCTFFSLILAGTWNRRREIFSSRMCTAGGCVELLVSLWSRATCLPRDSNLCRSLLCPQGVSGPLGVPGTPAGAACPLPGRDGGRWQEIPAAPPLPWPKRTRERVFGGRLGPRAAGGASEGHTGHCSLSARGGNSGWTPCVPPSQHCRGLILGCERGIPQSGSSWELVKPHVWRLSGWWWRWDSPGGTAPVAQPARGGSPAPRGWSMARARGLSAFPEL